MLSRQFTFLPLLLLTPLTYRIFVAQLLPVELPRGVKRPTGQLCRPPGAAGGSSPPKSSRSLNWIPSDPGRETARQVIGQFAELLFCQILQVLGSGRTYPTVAPLLPAELPRDGKRPTGQLPAREKGMSDGSRWWTSRRPSSCRPSGSAGSLLPSLLPTPPAAAPRARASPHRRPPTPRGYLVQDVLEYHLTLLPTVFGRTPTRHGESCSLALLLGSVGQALLPTCLAVAAPVPPGALTARRCSPPAWRCSHRCT